MAPPTLKKWVALQSVRLEEMRLIRESFRGGDSATLSKAVIRSQLERLNEIWEDVCKTHAEISAKEGAETDPYMVDDVFATLHATYEDVRDLLVTSRVPFEAREELVSSIRRADVEPSEPEADASVARLPRMPLPTFSGKYEDWESFCDLFTALVHEVPKFADVTKLQFLKSCLKGPAAELIKDVKTTNANYVSTWSTLKARYHPRLILAKYLTSLLQLQHLKKESAVGLRAFTDDATRIVRALTNMKLPVAHWDQWLVHILAERLDPESRRLWEAELSAKDRKAALSMGSADFELLKYLPTFADIIDFLERRAQTLNMLSSESLTNNKGEKRTAHDSKPVNKTRKVFHASTSSSTSDKAKCIACSGAHPLIKCVSFKAKSASDRRDCVQRSGACYNCLGKHRVRDCQSNKRCGVPGCQRKHHTLLHPKAATVQAAESRAPPTEKSEGADAETKPPSFYNFLSLRTEFC
ncbi:PREDICTED: uncharacterized protein LOC105563611 [Vollenhovia emeryi]|uniref:uncharacterized protein LOC105563611 n=1 Tax=Vollenhovia emeryi TaxID=411798 RepID=UPI0005F4B9CE|nr:PREDICTED: uncharacterized protein LOC105563611 [Vollenhovia emeryi]XP_011870723.1 PREDICTED: uncharacterized protein LOC105563611 [Vollenhovia emeryi]